MTYLLIFIAYIIATSILGWFANRPKKTLSDIYGGPSPVFISISEWAENNKLNETFEPYQLKENDPANIILKRKTKSFWHTTSGGVVAVSASNKTRIFTRVEIESKIIFEDDLIKDNPKYKKLILEKERLVRMEKAIINRGNRLKTAIAMGIQCGKTEQQTEFIQQYLGKPFKPGTFSNKINLKPKA